MPLVSGAPGVKKIPKCIQCSHMKEQDNEREGQLGGGSYEST